MPTEVGSISREHVEAFLVDVMERTSPATAEARYRGLRQFFNWYEAEGEVPVSPMARMSPPKVTEQPVEVPPVEDPPVPGAVDTYERVTGVLVLRIFSSYRRMISQKEIRTSGVRISTATHNKRRALLFSGIVNR